MTLDEAIKHCEERAEQDCSACASEHKQLAEWLCELKQLRDKDNIKRALRLASEKHWETSDDLTDVDDIYDKGWTDALLYVAKELGLKF